MHTGHFYKDCNRLAGCLVEQHLIYLFLSLVTRFPRPASPLQDLAIIIGNRELLSSLLLLYDHQLEHEGTTGWESLLWVVNQL